MTELHNNEEKQKQYSVTPPTPRKEDFNTAHYLSKKTYNKGTKIHHETHQRDTGS